ncbi:hypothetical protein C2845_PM09G23260 [Panicum miliaceum]|uniref:RNase H type-1 domain-containing protein n=1 Tax=Panicum miliaceum TaxID=4540 RepID=A0A3L6S506_PANMI|nr:hypothetical protein C2845_PM09G23260 [Panicum miliaceum]
MPEGIGRGEAAAVTSSIGGSGALRTDKQIGDQMKINTDGAFSQLSGDGGWGFVIRDEAGEVLKAGAGRIPYVSDAFHAEVIACLGQVVIETDSVMLKQALLSNDYRLAASGGLIYELKHIISTSFIFTSIVYAPRSCNQVAHALAAKGCKCAPDNPVLWDGTPDGVEDLVASDLAEPLS